MIPAIQFQPRILPRSILLCSVLFLVTLLPVAARELTPPIPDGQALIQPGAVPEGLTAPEWDGIQNAVAAAEYHFAYHEATDQIPAPYYWAPNRSQGWDTNFTNSGIQVTPADNDRWQWGLALSHYGYDDAMQAVTTPQLTADKARLTYRWDSNLAEWWINDPAGLEQGFTLQKRPAGGTDDSPLQIQMDINGNLTSFQTADSIHFQNESGVTVMHYAQLHVIDAKGLTIPAHLSLTDPNTLVITVDDADAAYPLIIDPWVQTAKITTSDAGMSDRFARSIAVSGNTVVVGAIRNDGAVDNVGAAYVFERPVGGWANCGPPCIDVAKLTASDGATQDRLGWSISVSGNIVVAGTPTNNGVGASYIFERPGGGWTDMTQTAKLTASDAAADDDFGHSIGVSGDTVVVGARYEDDAGADAGAAYVFVEPGGGWATMTETAKLAASDTSASDQFGYSVAISGDTVAVGAHLEDGAGNNAGAAYIFEPPGGDWSTCPSPCNETAKLTAGDAAGNDQLGFSVSVSEGTTEDVVVAGSRNDDDNGINSGAAYVFVRPGGGWGNMTQTAKLTAGDGAASDQLGRSVSVSDETVVAGAPFDDDGGSDTGAVYLFSRPGGGWGNMTQTAKLTVSNATADDRFGYSVSISEDTVAVGSVPKGLLGNNVGPAYIFEEPTGGWTTMTETTDLTAGGAGHDHEFGLSVSISGDTLVVGEPYDNGRGAAYIFERPTNGWTTMTETVKLIASDAAPDDWFGYRVSISGSTVVVGAPQDDDGGDNAGAAYVFERPASGWGNCTDPCTETIKLTAADATADDEFGWALSLSGDTVAVGAKGEQSVGGAVYVFVRPAGGWSGCGSPCNETAKLIASDASALSLVGFSVSIYGDTIATGAAWDNNGAGNKSGSAYVFVRPVGGWSSCGAPCNETVKLIASDAAADDEFGTSVSTDGETVVVGAKYDDAGMTNDDAGSAYLFERPVGGWSSCGAPCNETVKLIASDALEGDWFGFSTSINEDTVVVGAPAPYRFPNAEGGAAYIFVRPAGGWSSCGAPCNETASLTSADIAPNDWYGWGISVSGDTIAVGAPHDDDGGSNSGSAYVVQNSYCSKQSGDWDETATWVGGIVPGSSNDACITTGDTVTLAANAAANRLLVNPNAALDLSTFSLTIEDTVTNNGTLSQTQTVNSANVEFLHIQNIAVTNTAYRGLVVDSSGQSQNLGAVDASVREIYDWFGWYNSDNLDTTQYCTDDGASSPPYAERCYEISPTSQPVLSVTVRLYARTVDELNGIAEGDLAVFRNYPNGGDGWVELTNSATTGSNGGYSYAQADTPGFSHFLLGQRSNAPTAITLQALHASSGATDFPSVGVLLGLVALLAGGAAVVAWRRKDWQGRDAQFYRTPS